MAAGENVLDVYRDTAIARWVINFVQDLTTTQKSNINEEHILSLYVRATVKLSAISIGSQPQPNNKASHYSSHQLWQCGSNWELFLNKLCTRFNLVARQDLLDRPTPPPIRHRNLEWHRAEKESCVYFTIMKLNRSWYCSVNQQTTDLELSTIWHYERLSM